MSMSQRPSRNGSHRAHRESSRRRRRDLETGGYSGLPPSSSSRRRSRDSPRPRRPRDADEEMVPGEEFRRKKTLVKPERNPANPDYPNYNYRQESHDMPTDPSATENESALEDDLDAETSSLRAMEHRRTDDSDVDYEPINHRPMEHASSQPRSHKRRPPRRISKRRSRAAQRRQKQVEPARPPSLWSVYCGFLTFWAPDFILRCFRMPAKEQRTAWREKMGLIGVILLVAAFVGFLTFGFTATVCGTPPTRLKSNQITTNYMVFHGKAYDLTTFKHPAAAGIPSGKNVLYDLPHKYGGQDGSFFFQNVNGACKNLITLAPDSDVPTNSNGDLAWYFPCRAVNQDGSSKPNFTEPFYPGWACHTSGKARKTFLNMKSHGDVYYNWDDIKNKSRNLAVYSGEVVDFDLLRWFNTSQVSYPSKFDELRKNSNVRGADLTYYFQTGTEKKIGRCLTEVAKVGSIDGDTVGCIASKVVLYVSLVFILGIVIVKFGFALVFGWFMSRQFAPPKPSMTSDRKSRNQQIEDWSNDIYRPGPRLMEPAVAPDRTSKRASFLPTTSRFSSPYVIGSGGKRKPQYITMTTQNSTTNLITSGTASSRRPSRDGNEGSLSASVSRGSRSVRESSFEGIVGPAEFNADCVIPQPPPEWQPFGFPLAHSLCLVTCYSEGEEGIRTTLDSIAMTDYPNSHKTIIVICDGIIKGKGEEFSTPEIVLRMMHDHVVHPDDARSFSYVAVASGSKRHNMAKVYAGFYDFGENSVVPSEKRQRVPMILVSKCGTQAEANAAKPGNRGKRDSQIILMSFLQKVMFDERMTELEYEMFNGFWNVTGLPPDFYEMILMVDADTKVFPDSMTHMICAMVKDPEIMGLCGETKIANKTQSWVTMIQVFEYFISHHQAKAFESVFGGVTCLPGCFSMYRIKAPKGGQNYWVPILANPDIVENYSENVVDTLHKKNLLLLGEDRYLSTLMLKTFPKRKQVFVPQAVCKTMAPDEFKVLLSQRRRWINSTVHNLFELVLVRDLCGTFCFSMQFVIFIELVGTLVLPAAIAFTFYVVIKSIVQKPVQVIPLVLLALILGLPGVLIVITANNKVYVLWMLIYLLALPIWNFILPTYSYWKFDDFSWGDTRKTVGGSKGGHDTAEGEFDSSKITMKRWRDFERERRQRMQPKWSQSNTTGQYPSEHDPYPKF